MAGFRQTLARAQLDAMRSDFDRLRADIESGLTLKVAGLKEAGADADALVAKLKAAQGAMGGLATGAAPVGAAFSTASATDFKASVWEGAKPVPTGADARRAIGQGRKARAANDNGSGILDVLKKEGAGGAGGGGTPKDLKYLLKHAGIGKAAMGAMGAAAGLELTKLALGIRGMAQLDQVTTRAGLNIRGLFRGVDSGPVVRAADRFFQIFDQRTITGKALATTMEGIFKTVFSAVEAAEPYVSAFFKGMFIGALQAQTAWLELQLAILPIKDALEDALGPFASIQNAATLGQVAFAMLGAYGVSALYGIATAGATAAASLAPFIAAAAAIGAVVDQIRKLKAEIEGAGGIGGAISDMAHLASRPSLEAGEKRRQDEGRQAYEEAQARFARERAEKSGGAGGVPAADPKAAASAGAVTGQAFADGVAQGVRTGAPAAAEAGKALAGVVDQGVRAGGKIKSPSGLLRDTAKNFPLGAAEGIDDGKAAVQAAADRSMVPSLGALGGGGARGGGASGAITVIHQWPAGALSAPRQDIEAAAEAGTNKALRAWFAQMGGSLAA